MKGYKLMESDMTCNGFQYEIGKEYSLEGELEICKKGFHFCQNPFDYLYYYDNIKGNKRLFLVEALGEVITEGNKSVTDKIKMLEEIKDIEKFFDENWFNLCSNQKLSFIEKHINKVDWYFISKYQKLSEEFIEKYIDKVNWKFISQYQKLSEEFIDKYKDKVEWSYISLYQTLSEEFIEKHGDKVDWNYIFMYQILSKEFSKEFIEKHGDKVDWWYISKHQKLSEEFIDKYNDKVDWYWISKNQKLSEKFIEKHLKKLRLYSF